MIPKIIHYCWFGGNPLPELAVKCINSWKKYCSGYEIKEWNESNFDLSSCDYIKEAYENKKWAFVSDYARFKILYEEGGIYFDTDVEMINGIDDIVAKGSFMGCEPIMKKRPLFFYNRNIELGLAVAPGLGLAVNPGLGLYKEIIDHYNKTHFTNEKKGMDFTTVVVRVTEIMKNYGWKEIETVQYCEGVYIYPSEYFCPLSPVDGVLKVTNKTRTIHHYTASWLSPRRRIINKIFWSLRKKGRTGYIIEQILALPFKIIRQVVRYYFTN